MLRSHTLKGNLALLWVSKTPAALGLNRYFNHPVRDPVSFAHIKKMNEQEEVIRNSGGNKCLVLPTLYWCCNAPAFILNMVIGLYFAALIFGSRPNC